MSNADLEALQNLLPEIVEDLGEDAVLDIAKAILASGRLKAWPIRACTHI